MRKPRPATYNPAQALHLIASDRTGSRPAHRPVSPAEFAATLYRLLGLDTADARMRPFVRDALPVAELL